MAVAKVIKTSIVGVGLAIDVRNVPITDSQNPPQPHQWLGKSAYNKVRKSYFSNLLIKWKTYDDCQVDLEESAYST